jgi:hypothetical protein
MRQCQEWVAVLVIATLKLLGPDGNVAPAAPATIAATNPAQPANSPATRDASKQWLRRAKYGVFITFLVGGADWNATVDAFDVATFAAQMQQAGAGYVILTLGQNTGFYCAPNATYDRFGGFAAGQRCSRRDLPMELSEMLGRRGIKLLLYCTARAPQNDKQARKGLAEIDDIIDAPATQEFSRRWWAVIREWSQRYGQRVAGWWFDGAYVTGGWDDPTKQYNWHTWAEAARAGNPGRLLAFNKGTHLEDAFGALADEQDYTAGERNGFDVTPRDAPGRPGLVWHLLGYMGKDWGKAGAPAKTDTWMIDYIRRINDDGGVVTMDVHVENGRVHEPHLKQLIAIRDALRGR